MGWIKGLKRPLLYKNQFPRTKKDLKGPWEPCNNNNNNNNFKKWNQKSNGNNNIYIYFLKQKQNNKQINTHTKMMSYSLLASVPHLQWTASRTPAPRTPLGPAARRSGGLEPRTRWAPAHRRRRSACPLRAPCTACPSRRWRRRRPPPRTPRPADWTLRTTQNDNNNNNNNNDNNNDNNNNKIIITKIIIIIKK